jgi:TetR/AcrR family transcriptional repressor of mexJK operon
MANEIGPPEAAGAERRRAGPGRPRDPAKRAGILRAARELFFRHGVEAVTMEDIAARAGVAKATLYTHFGDKESLFGAMVSAETDRMAETLTTPAGAEALPLRAALEEFGVRLTSFLMDPEIVAFDRLLSAEIGRHPEYARRIAEHGPGRMHRELSALLAGAMARGELEGCEPTFAAEMLAGMFQGLWAVEARLGVRSRPAEPELRARAGRVVERFCLAFGCAGGDEADRLPSTRGRRR